MIKSESNVIFDEYASHGCVLVDSKAFAVEDSFAMVVLFSCIVVNYQTPGTFRHDGKGFDIENSFARILLFFCVVVNHDAPGTFRLDRKPVIKVILYIFLDLQLVGLGWVP